MFLNERTASNELRTLRSLNVRTTLSKKERQYYWHLEKGFEGECWLDKRLEVLPDQVLILRDLTYEVSHTTFQIDTLLIFQEKLYLLDVKNNDGDHYIEGGVWKTAQGTEIKNPQHQLLRCTSLLRKLLQIIGINLNICAYLIFVNPEFTLYQAPRTPEIIFPSQLNRFIEKLKAEPCNLSHMHQRIANQLLQDRLKENRHQIQFTYQLDQMKKGILCSECYGFMRRYNQKRLICLKCKKIDLTTNKISSNIDEFKFLFPDKKITSKYIYNWCGGVATMDVIRRVLNQKYDLISQGRSSYYVEKSKPD